MPLVLAIEPDVRQAAIVKRIVREKVLADVAVVDSRDAALEAMRTTVPDVLLLSALLSPRDEDELIAHLRSLRDAEHLQTHTIPQLASSFGIDDDDQPRGLFSAFKRKKNSASATAGCDPDLFADEIKSYLKRAADKKREVRSGPALEPIVSRARPAQPKPEADAPEPVQESSWESPFEWRPSRPSRSAPPPPPEPIVAKVAIPIADPEPLIYTPDPIPEPEPAFAAVEPSIDLPMPRLVEEPLKLRVKAPLTMRHPRGWWYEEQERRATSESDSELDAVLRSLAVPSMIAGVAYADGCRIRRVRLVGAA
jgi:CheY-like chemotaxis protein